MMLILLKLALAVGDGLLGVWVLRTGALEKWADGIFLRRMAALQVIPAIVLFLGLYVVGHQEVPSDVPGYYLPAAHAALAGGLPFRDFMLSYAPLFPYVGAALVWVWDSGKMFALFSILANAVALVFWHRMASATLERQTARQSTLLFATSGHLLQQTLLGTNQTWIGAALAASALLIATERAPGSWRVSGAESAPDSEGSAPGFGRSFASGLVQAMAACMTKILVLLFWPALWICARHRWRWLAAALLPAVGLYAAFAAAGGDILYPLRFEGSLVTSGNLPYVLDPLLSAVAGSAKKAICDLALLVALGGTTLWLFLRIRTLTPRQRAAALPLALALTGVVFLLVSKKSYTGYAVFVMYPITVALGVGVRDLRARVGFLLLFNALLATEPSLWFRLGGSNGNGTLPAGFVLVDVALLACYVWVAWVSVRSLLRTTDGAMASNNASQSATACSLV